MKNTIILSLLLLATTAFGQQIRYVTAKNGLSVRANPGLDAERIGKLVFGTPVEVVSETDIELSIPDGNELVNGRWVKIYEIDGALDGYVFDGYLNTDHPGNPFEIQFDGISFHMNLEGWEEVDDSNKTHQDTAKIYIELGETPEGKKITIHNAKFKRIEVFQRHENSVTIMNEGPHCDLTEWKHYDSNWKQLEFNTVEGSFITDSYTPEDWEKFIPVDLNEFEEAVKVQCGEYWMEHIKGIKSVTEYPSGVSISRIFLKLLLTDEKDSVTEKIIEFVIPMGC
jgi:hypothetical protein